MKYLGFLAVTALFFTACLKNTNPPTPARLYDYMAFAHVEGPDTVTVTDTIAFSIRVTGSRSCYKLEGYEGITSGDKQYDIKAVGSYPNPVLGDTLGCIGTYVKDTIVRFAPKSVGKQVFRFYNNSTLFKADTVVVK